MNLLYESMTRIQWGAWTIRVWRQFEAGDVVDNGDIHEVVESEVRLAWAGDVVKRILKLDRVNAVELVDASGNGTVVYKDWP